MTSTETLLRNTVQGIIQATKDTPNFQENLILKRDIQTLHEQMLEFLQLIQQENYQDVDSALKVLSLFLGWTDLWNWPIVYTLNQKKEKLDPIKMILIPQIDQLKKLNTGSQSHSQQQIKIQGTLETIFRFFHYQITLRKIWNCEVLFTLPDLLTLENPQQISIYLKGLFFDSMPISFNLIQFLESKVKVNSIEFVNSQSFEYSDNENLILTNYLGSKVQESLLNLRKNIFTHLAVFGPQTSGRTSFVQLLKKQFDCQFGCENKGLIIITLDESFDSKNLVGTYVSDELGQFQFKKGPLTVAAEQGLWLVLRGLERAPPDLLSFLLPLIEDNILQVSATLKITPKLGFRIIAICHQNENLNNEIQEDLHGLSPLLRLMQFSRLETLREREDFNEILKYLGPNIYMISWLPNLLMTSTKFIEKKFKDFSGSLFDIIKHSVRHLFKLFKRVNSSLVSNYNDMQNNEVSYLSYNQLLSILQDIIEIYLAYCYSKECVSSIIISLVNEIINPCLQENGQMPFDQSQLKDYILNLGREHAISNQNFYFGRSAHFQRKNQDQNQLENEQINSEFVFTSATQRLLEQLCKSSLENGESTLLVGETGTGKTSVVQELAKLSGHHLHVFNMNQNTDASDLLGGFKPVDLKFLLKPAYQQFLNLFKSIFSQNKNNQFLEILQKCYQNNQPKEFVLCLTKGIENMNNAKQKETMKKLSLENEFNSLCQRVNELRKRSRKLEQGGGFIFQFIEGTLIQAMQKGEWILLDEINLASDSVLNRLSTLIDGNHILLNERADIIETRPHQDFRLFLCMNPPYSSAGKKQLPNTLRIKLTELYVPELTTENDLWPIVDRLAPITMFSEKQRRNLLKFYLDARLEVTKQNRRANLGLRNLTRALRMMRNAIVKQVPQLRAIHDSLLTCFASHLDPTLQVKLSNMIYSLFEITKLPQIDQSQVKQGFVKVGNFQINLGSSKPQNFREKDFILTKSFTGLVNTLASIVAVTDFAVILEGPTSAGKTSTVQYLAQITHNKVIRINNHMHTDIQEYIGSYVPSENHKDAGKLIFQEGVLVEAVRNGYWVILDELNLAPSEVLEALNRLLDDNRELHIVETQQTIKAHPNFRLFATQNPTEGYGGRKELSEAFKNRFILIRVQDVPTDELEQILIQKCGLPESRTKIMVKALVNLQIYRSKASLFSGKDSVITVRDLLKWADRVSRVNKTLTVPEIAMEGFLLFAERARNAEDRQFIKTCLEQTMRCKLDPVSYYEQQFYENKLDKALKDIPSSLGVPEIILTRQIKRLAVLINKCLQNREPVLLVGETGCGKTTLCQVFAALNNQSLYSINCHQNTETSDFIGCMRTKKNFQKTQETFEQAYNSLYEISSKILDDNQLQKLNQEKQISQRSHLLLKLLKKQTNPDFAIQVETLKLAQLDAERVFEWHDGILVEAMRDGGLLLIDEISLANDSVLERLNSVLERERTLTLTEQSAAEAIKIQAQDNFNIVATMNPSGDFGKKELSPALRNRLTEIWVESYFVQPELLSLQKSEIHTDVKTLGQIDLATIIFSLVNSKLTNFTKKEQIALSIFNMLVFTNFTLAQKFQVMARKPLSVRDVINTVEFLNLNLKWSDEAEAVYHALQLVFIDGLALGIDFATLKQKEQVCMMAQEYFDSVMKLLFQRSIESCQLMSIFQETSSEIGVTPFKITKLYEAQQPVAFSFDANTTKQNLLKLLRAIQLKKPILLEGPPGAGKTSLIENLSKVTGRKLSRVNLSEQTDMMDLLGSEYPISVSSSQNDGSDDNQEIRFKWCDGILLRAIKEGHWFLIDEMNLAQQSVLEGLNAILDHRRTIFIPELNQEFICHPNFFVFACQNPSQSSSSVGGRKSLPKSFLNRFTKIFLEQLSAQDYEIIIENKITSDSLLQNLNVQNLLEMTFEYERILKLKNNNDFNLESNELNLRDLNRFLILLRQFLEETCGNIEISLGKAMDICYLKNFNKFEKTSVYEQLLMKMNKNIPDFQNIAYNIQQNVLINLDLNNSLVFQHSKSTILKPQKANFELELQDFLNLRGDNAKSLQHIVDCTNAKLPMLIITDDALQAVKNLQTIYNFYPSSSSSSKTILRMLLNQRSDTGQLLGCFEQIQSDKLSHLITQLKDLLSSQKTSYSQTVLYQLEFLINSHSNKDLHKLLKELCSQNIYKKTCEKILNLLKEIENEEQIDQQSGFAWGDSLLLEAMEQGKWLILQNANLCPASILDRLNSLLEEGNNSLTLNEQGLADDRESLRVVRGHQDFRIMFLVETGLGTDGMRDQALQGMSKALKNRCMQIELRYNNPGYKIENQLQIQVEAINERGNEQVFLNKGPSLNIFNSLIKSDNILLNLKQDLVIQSLGKRQLSANENQPRISLFTPFQQQILLTIYLSLHPAHSDLNIILQQIPLENNSQFLDFLKKQKSISLDTIFEFQNKNFLQLLKQTLRRDDIPHIFRKILEHIGSSLPAPGGQELRQFQIMNILESLTLEIQKEGWNMSEENFKVLLLGVGQTFGLPEGFKDQGSLQDLSSEDQIFIKALKFHGVEGKKIFENRSLSEVQKSLIYESLKQQQQIDCQAYSDVWITNKKDLTSCHQGLQSILDNFEVILLSDEKEILISNLQVSDPDKPENPPRRQQIEKDDYLKIGELLLDQSPYLIISSDSQAVITSQCNLYRNLVYFKDFTKLFKTIFIQQKGQDFAENLQQNLVYKRKSDVNVVLRDKFLRNSSTFYASLFMNFYVIIRKLRGEVINMIENTLQEQGEVSLRDQSSYYYNALTLNFKLEELDLLSKQGWLAHNIQEQFLEKLDQIIQQLPEEQSDIEKLYDEITQKIYFCLLAPFKALDYQQQNQFITYQILYPYLALFTRLYRSSEQAFINPYIQKFDALSKHLQKQNIEQEFLASQSPPFQFLVESLTRLQNLNYVALKVKNATNLSASESTHNLDLLENQLKQFLLPKTATPSAILELGDIIMSSSYFIQLLHLLAHCQLTKPKIPKEIFTIESLSKNLKTQEKQMCWYSRASQILNGKFLKKVSRAGDSNVSVASIFDKMRRVQLLQFEVGRKVAEHLQVEQDSDEDIQIFKVPFTLNEQVLRGNKAIDELTKKDKKELEKEQNLEIMREFPSYLNELESQFANYQREERLIQKKQIDSRINFDIAFADALQINNLSQQDQLIKWQQLRHTIIAEQIISDEEVTIYQWLQQSICGFKNIISSINKKCSTNIKDFDMPDYYNFYIDGLLQESVLAYQPLTSLQKRVLQIMKDGYESPILNDLLIMTNYMLTQLNAKQSPIMKFLTGFELILEKLQEWESFASKRLNSCFHQEQEIKQLIIRYRKIQILSWRNLLASKHRSQQIQDFENISRLIHTVVRQVYDSNLYKTKKLPKLEEDLSIEMQILDLIDMFIRDSSLAVFKTRLKSLKLLKEMLEVFHEILTQSSLGNFYSQHIKLPMNYTKEQSILCQRRSKYCQSILSYIINYYGQFEEKLDKTIDRLDKQAREKIKTLIDVSKWTVQKFDQVRSNIDKTHRQLHRACKLEDEILMQNIQSLILTSSRKKFTGGVVEGGGDKLLTLDGERKEMTNQIKDKIQKKFELNLGNNSVIKQLDYFAQNQIWTKWPSQNDLEETIIDLFDRLVLVRDLDRKHFQRKALIDLFKFMKDQGLKANFQDRMQSFVIKSQLIEDVPEVGEKLKKYFFKSQELLNVLEQSSQTQEHSDLKNVEIIRMQSFSKSLVKTILSINLSLTNLQDTFKSLQENQDPSQPKNFDFVTHPECEGFSIKDLNTLKRNEFEFQKKCDEVCFQLKVIAYEEDLNQTKTLKLDYNNVTEQTQDFQKELLQKIQNVKIQILNVQVQDSFRSKIIIESFLNYLSNLESQTLIVMREQVVEAPDQQGQSLQGVKAAQLVYQSVFNHLKSWNDDFKHDKIQSTAAGISNSSCQNEQLSEIVRKESFDYEKNEQLELTFEEHLNFLNQLREVLSNNLAIKQIQKIGKEFSKENSSNEPLSIEKIEILAVNQMVREKVAQLLGEIIKKYTIFLVSMCKFSYISQRIFVYLIYQGFCGKDDSKTEEEKEQEKEDDKYFDNEGAGMGDGEGQQNVSNQIENEEQLEGLKNYESEEEQQKEEKDKQKNEDEEDKKNDFEMENDFDGDNEEDEKQENDEEDEKKSDDGDDEMDQVDDLLDNQLWDQNMQDMQDKEDENDEENKEEKPREIDLGDRELEDRNKTQDKKEKEMTDGDNDKQRKDKQKQEDQPMEDDQVDKESLVEEDKGGSEEGKDESEERDDDVPLNRPEFIEEEEEQKSDQQPESGNEMDQEQKDEMSEVENSQDSALSENKPEEENQISEMDPEAMQERSFSDINSEQQNSDQEEEASQVGGDDDQSEHENPEKDEGDDGVDPNEEQRNVKESRGQKNLNDKEQNAQQQNEQPKDQNEQMQNQLEADGNNVLFQMAQQLQKKLDSKKKDQQKQPAPQKLDPEKQQIQNPQMIDQEDKPEEQLNEQPQQEGAEYDFDDQEADQLQGKLAADQFQEDEQMQGENESVKEQNEDESDQEEKIDKTKTQIKQQQVKKDEKQKKQEKIKNDIKNDEIMDEVSELEEQEDLLDKYQQFLNERQKIEASEDHQSMQIDQQTYIQDFSQFDYLLEKRKLNQMFFEWKNQNDIVTQAVLLLARFKTETVEAVAQLCEQLRIVLEPQLSQQMQGDFKTGKRLNMKKVISFIASRYRNDKIWLRRTLPSKRDYKILIAIDDSLSMKENNLGFFSLEATITMIEAMNRLEVGKVAVARIRERMELLQTFEDSYSNERSSFIISQFDFKHCGKNSHDISMANFVQDSNKLLDLQNSSSLSQGSLSCPFVIILSDGRFNKANVRKYMQEASEKKYLYIFVILDAQNSQQTPEKQNTQSILNLRSAVRGNDGSIQLEPYLKDFPFCYYCIVTDLQQLTSSLSQILVQWFSMTNNST